MGCTLTVRVSGKDAVVGSVVIGSFGSLSPLGYRGEAGFGPEAMTFFFKLGWLFGAAGGCSPLCSLSHRSRFE